MHNIENKFTFRIGTEFHCILLLVVLEQINKLSNMKKKIILSVFL